MPGGWRSPLASVLLLVLAFPPIDVVPAAPLALAPLGVWIARRGEGGEAFRGGLLFGVVLWLVLLRWLPLTLGRFLPWALPGWLVVVGVLGLVAGGVVWSAWWLHRRASVPLWLALPLAWTAGEWLRAHLPGALAFPWLELSVSLAAVPELAGLAEVMGGRGLGFLLALASGLVAEAWLRRAALPALAALAICAGAGGWGAWRAATLETRPGPVVAVVQTAVPQELKADRWTAAEAGVATLERLLPRVAGAGEAPRGARVAGVPDVVVLPEAVLPVRLEQARAAGLRRRVEAAVDRAGVPVLVGALGLRGAGGGGEDDVAYNSVFLVRPGEGLTPGRYDKRHLVPVVERMPLPTWAGGGDGGRWGSYGAGEAVAPFDVGGHRAGALICLESSFARAARRLRLAGADVLVNPTNDAWLNGTAAWTRTSALSQHPAHLVLRAVETRTPAARAANTGLSMFVDVAGRRHGVLGPFEEGVSVRALEVGVRPTLFVRFGDVAGLVSFASVLLLVGVSAAVRGASGRGRTREVG